MNCKFLIQSLFLTATIFCASCFHPQRSGEKLYQEFFGKEINSCVKILESRDVKAIDDQMMYLHFKGCPMEMKRILSIVPYTIKGMNKRQIDLEYDKPEEIDEDLIPSLPKWWNIRKLGDSCLRFEYYHPNEDYAQIGYFSLDSSEVFYKEISW